MKNFGIYMFNPQPEPPAQRFATATGGDPQAYTITFSDVLVSSYQSGG